jgi:hypothetical protein
MGAVSNQGISTSFMGCPELGVSPIIPVRVSPIYPVCTYPLANTPMNLTVAFGAQRLSTRRYAAGRRAHDKSSANICRRYPVWWRTVESVADIEAHGNRMVIFGLSV